MPGTPLGSDDIPGELAERYGSVNGAAEPGTFVDTFATRVADLDKRAISGTRSLVDQVSVPTDGEIPPTFEAFSDSVRRTR